MDWTDAILMIVLKLAVPVSTIQEGSLAPKVTGATIQELRNNQRRLRLSTDLISAQRGDHLVQPAKVTITHVPVEILGLIFALYLPSTAPHSGIIHSELIHLMLVCKVWKDIVVSTPYLWTNLLIKEMDSRNPVHYDLLQQAFLRSGVCPLTLCINTPISRKNDDQHDHHHYYHYLERWDAILDQLIRCEDLELRVLDHSHPMVARIQSKDTKFIKNLCFQLYDTSSHFPSRFSEAIKKAPQLESIRWKTSALEIQSVLQGAYWPRLTSVTISSEVLTVHDCYHILAASPKLEKCVIKTVSNRLGTVPRGSITHDSIIDLTIVTRANISQPLINLVTLPSLQNLKIQVVNVQKMHGFSDFFRRSRPPLLSLSLANVRLNESQLIESLSLVPSLNSLEIQEDYSPNLPRNLTRRIISKLTRGPDDLAGGDLLPNLKELRLLGLSSSVTSFHRMSVSRMEERKVNITKSLTYLEVLLVKFARGVSKNRNAVICLQDLKESSIAFDSSFCRE